MKQPDGSQSSRRGFLKASIGTMLAGSLFSNLQARTDAASFSKKPLGAEPPMPDTAKLPFRIGAAEADITPDWPTFLSGYAYRKEKSKGVYQPIKTRAMTISDGRTTVAWIMADICYWESEMKLVGIISGIQGELKKQYGLAPEQVFMVATHTHCGPSVSDKKFADLLIKRVVATVGEALNNAREGRLFFGRGRTDVGVSRRAHNIDGGDAWEMNPYGPHDHEVVVIKAVDRAGKPIAAVMNYGCHPTTMGGYLIGGDFPGFAQAELTKRLGAPALFLQGCGGDGKPRNPDLKNPLIFKKPDEATVDDVKRIGHQFAGDAARVMEGPMEEITGAIRVATKSIQVPVLIASKLTETGDPENKPDPANPFSGPQRRMARMSRAMFDSMDARGTYRVTHGWEIHALRIGPSFIHVAFCGEVCSPIGLRVKDQLRGNNVLVTAYTGMDTDYFPGQEQLAAGGYEVFSNPNQKPYSPEAEDVLVCAAMETVKSLASRA